MEPLEGKMTKSPNLDLISTKRKRIAELAGQAPAVATVIFGALWTSEYVMLA
jgi:hypothetical protein